MNDTNRPFDWVNQKDGTTIGHVNSKHNARLFREQPVESGQRLIATRIFNDRELAAMNLFRGDQWPAANA